MKETIAMVPPGLTGPVEETGPGRPRNSVVLYDAGRQQWVRYTRPLRVYVAQTLDSVLGTFRAVEHEVTINGLQAAGFIAYEAGAAFDSALPVRSPGSFPMLWFGLYDEPEPITFPPLPEADPLFMPWRSSVSEEEYRRCFFQVKEYIGAGDTYQVNYTFRLQAPFSEDPWSLFVRMVHAQGYGYGAFVDAGDWVICSASPELFLRLEGDELISKPMKGTAARGRRQTDDRRQAEWLAASEKNRAENVMIVDMVRNDMGRIARKGSVEVTHLFDVEKYPTLWQMTSTVRCRTTGTMSEILCALFPAASITGAPKVRTMQIIDQLENQPRRIYTGSVGFLSPGRRAQFNVAIRTVLVDRVNQRAEYGVGGGLVWDSENADELQECHTKAKVLTQGIPHFSLLESILWTPGEGYSLLDRHLARLSDSAAYFDRPVDAEAIRGRLEALATSLPPVPHKIRLLVQETGELRMEAQVLVPHPKLYRLGLAKRPVNSRDPFMYHKTTHRAVYELALAESPEYNDVLLWNEREEVTESCTANLVLEMDGTFVTPPLHSGLLAGTYRSLLLEQGKVSEQVIRVEDLKRCTRIYLINSVRGMWEVRVDS